MERCARNPYIGLMAIQTKNFMKIKQVVPMFSK
jgi:hypothetical protein